MTLELGIILLLFAVAGYAGAGASFAVARARRRTEGERDVGMLGVGVLLLAFATLCISVLSGPSGVLAVGGTFGWASYVHAAQRLGMFEVGAGPLGPVAEEEPRHTT